MSGFGPLSLFSSQVVPEITNKIGEQASSRIKKIFISENSNVNMKVIVKHDYFGRFVLEIENFSEELSINFVSDNLKLKKFLLLKIHEIPFAVSFNGSAI